MKKIAISVTNDLVTDNRVHKIASTLQEMGHEVTLIGRLLPNSQKISRKYDTRRMNLFFSKGPLFYAEYNFRLFFILLLSKFDVFVANDLDSLMANFIVSRITGNPLFYDSHEYFTEVPELVNRPHIQKKWEQLEKKILPEIKYAYTVCQSIAEAYRYKYGTYFHVVRNVPERRIILSIPDDKKLNFTDKKIIIYQGVLNIGRGLEQMISAMQYIDNAIFIVAGDGDISHKLRQQVAQLNLQEKVKFLGKIPFTDLAYFTKQANLGISIEEDLGLNYKYALPNKLFDYIQAEIPVLVSNLPEMKKIVIDYKIGEVLKSHQPKMLAQQVSELLANDKQNENWKANLKVAAEELCWEKEKEKIKLIYEPLRSVL